MSNYVSANPATGEILRRFPFMTADALDKALDNAVAAQRQWRRSTPDERSAVLKKTASALRANAQKYAALITMEMGKPIVEARGEIEKCAWCCDFYASKAAEYLEPHAYETAASESYVALDPLGIVLAIMPWNFPFWQFFRFLAPALTAGNGIVFKHADNVPECALAMAALFDDVGAPKHLVQNLFIDVPDVDKLISDDRIAAVTLTGSTQVGTVVASTAGRNIKRHVLELGGSDPFVVLADADLDLAVKTGVRARFQNTGQSCIAAKRFILVDSIADKFTERFTAEVERLVVGDPTKEETQIGPMSRTRLRDSLQKQVEQSLAMGAKALTGGAILNRPGNYFAPTVLGNVTPNMPAFSEETFGPAAALIRVKNTEEAIAMANDTIYGLGASLWTRDLSNAKRLARDIDAGSVFINGLVASDPRLPFGGIKKSGYGRELGLFGVREFTNIKTVWIGPVK